MVTLVERLINIADLARELRGREPEVADRIVEEAMLAYRAHQAECANAARVGHMQRSDARFGAQ